MIEKLLDVSRSDFMHVSGKTRRWISLGVICLISTAIAFGLTGRQVFYTKWGLIDDHLIFSWIGDHQRLPISDFFHTLLAKTEIGDPSSERLRPSFVVLTLLESTVWGANVHLWYLARTLWLAIFIASLWWLLSKFVRIWLAGALVLPVLFMPFWADVWPRLLPSEVYGASALALMLVGIYATIEADERQRKWAAALVTFAAVVLVGSKETFIPLAGAAVAVLAFAGFTKRIPVWMAASFSLMICLYAAAIVFVIERIVLTRGQDYYANAIDLKQLLGIATHATNAAVFGNGLAFVYAFVIIFFGYCAKRQRQNLHDWIRSSCIIVAIFVFMAGIYFSQQVAYRGQLPLRMRYDFPAALFVPFSYYVLICYIFYHARLYLHPRATNYISIFLALAIFFTYAPGFAVSFNSKALPRAVSLNIRRTNAFYPEVSALAAFARQNPRSPIILEIYDPGMIEALVSIRTYVRTMGVENPVSVRLHMAAKSKGALYESLERQIRVMESGDDSQFDPISKSLASPENGCISVGINGDPNPACTAFEVKT